MKKVLVVISFYNARSEDQLDNLLWQIDHIPAGLPFDILVVVNRAIDKNLAIAAKYPNIKVVYRPNTGYNIAAWDHGWRSNKGYATYVFLQDDCLIARRGWLKSLTRRSDRALVGEVLIDDNQTWREAQQSYEEFYAGNGSKPEEWDVETGKLHTPNSIRAFMVAKTIPPRATMRHLRSLILCAPGALMEAMDGFPTGDTYRDSVAAEVAISQQALAKGFPIRQAGTLPFSYVIHPQWMADRCAARSVAYLIRALARKLRAPEARAARRV